jgi:thioredoxin-like negative regulator of GroEL
MARELLPGEAAIPQEDQLDTPFLLFFTTSQSGPARRMESLLAHLARKERGRLSIALIDADRETDWVERLKVTQIPTLVLIKDRRPVDRLEGRVSAPQIERMISPHLARTETQEAAA